MAEAVVKRGPGRPKKIKTDLDVKKEGLMKNVSKIVGSALAGYRMQPCKDIEEMKTRIDLFFEECMKQNMLPTVEGLALTLGVTRKALEDWESGKYAKEKGPIISKAKEVIAAVDAQLVASGVMPAVPYIFRAKNYYGMSDKTEVEIRSGEDRLSDEAELKRSIEESIVLEDEDFEEVE